MSISSLPLVESVVEEAALAWLESLGYTVKNRLEIPPGKLAAEGCGTVGQFGQAGRF